MVKFNVFDARELLAFPGGDNETDTVVGGVHFNLTTLQHWNYTLWGNRTLSNETECWLVFSPYEPRLVRDNGSFVNATSCYNAVRSIGTRGYTGIGFAALYGLGLVLTLTALTKHGALYLPKERRFYPIGRRWQWYWACFVCGCALISLFTNIDVDRYYLQDLPIIINVFFWFLVCQGTLALTWEAVRHWGSWLERQYVDPNPFIYREGDGRWQIEFWTPLWFYFWLWMNFFLVVPRNWNFVRAQHSIEQTAAVAAPTATGARFKAAAFCLVIAWLTIVFFVRHSIKHYKPRHRGLLNRTVAFAKAVPLRFVLIIPLTLVLIAYQAFISFVWEYSVIRYDGPVVVVFAWGYGPPLLIVFVQVLYGFASPNEDKELIRQRRERGEVVNRELGIVKRPAWWRRVRGEHLYSLRDKISRNVDEVGTERGVGRRAELENEVERDARLEAQGAAIDDEVELEEVVRRRPDAATNPRVDRAGARGASIAVPYAGKDERRQGERVMQSAASVLFPNNLAEQRAQRVAFLMEEGPAPPPYSDAVSTAEASTSAPAAQRSNSTSTVDSLSRPPQQVRSMLDV
ncbi:hypothetical protein DCS_03195 [Drechmeria coniospora]|uniref:Uncharacterized protein n=1 Tax=Drechmeria coniospora TaxID=98403 RepID=A0A151GY81_DRECN|nr:hypothetical protein DCS_03195 [Drechmeria coniospora]KYK62050.1 hypothetical protein DCS_03195 [Drechmeria coniospora]ODA81287.1 hypothetical protein RJ55_04252 [Drechmeria coniospora]